MAKVSLPQQQLQESSSQVCRAPCLQPDAAMDSPAQAQKLQQAAACSSSDALEQHSPSPHAVVPLQQHLQHLRLSPETPPRACADGACPGAQSEGSSSSSCEDCSSSSSSTSSDTPPAAQRQLPLQRLDSSRQEDLPSSSAATDSHQGDEAAVEPLLQDNPDRFTLGEIQ
jgi:hypothetical protein